MKDQKIDGKLLMIGEGHIYFPLTIIFTQLFNITGAVVLTLRGGEKIDKA